MLLLFYYTAILGPITDVYSAGASGTGNKIPGLVKKVKKWVTAFSSRDSSIGSLLQKHVTLLTRATKSLKKSDSNYVFADAPETNLRFTITQWLKNSNKVIQTTSYLSENIKKLHHFVNINN